MRESANFRARARVRRSPDALCASRVCIICIITMRSFALAGSRPLLRASVADKRVSRARGCSAVCRLDFERWSLTKGLLCARAQAPREEYSYG